MKKYLFILIIFTSCANDKLQVDDNNKKQVQTSNPAILTLPQKDQKGKVFGAFYGCGYNYVLNQNELDFGKPREREVDQIKNILNYTGLSQNFEIFSAPIENAVATMIENRRYIFYDPKLLNYADKNSDSYWSSMSILAHEIGHHLQGHTLDKMGSTPQKELEADKFSGHMLFKMGANLFQATAAINQFGSEQDSPTHPSKYKRIKAITDGWNTSAQQRYDSAIPPPPADDNNFQMDGYSKTEFSPKELIPINLKDNFYISGNESLVEGIILDSDYSSDDFSLLLIVTKDKNVNNDEKIIFKNGNKVNLWIPNFGNGNIGTADLSWLQKLLVPGRKIAFKPNIYGISPSGNGSYAIIYLEKKNR